MPQPDPSPPSAEGAARIVNESWKGRDMGAIVLLATNTGIRRGDLFALRWSHVDFDTGVLTWRSR